MGIIHEAVFIRGNMLGNKDLRPYCPKRRALKPEAQAKESPRFLSLARFDVALFACWIAFGRRPSSP
jgi:hypothetical protein